MKQSSISTALAATILFLLMSCGRERPVTFVENNSNWIVIKVAPGMKKDAVWSKVSDLLAKRYDLEVISPDIGYVRTAWKNTVDVNENGKVSNEYRKRVIVKISQDGSVVEIKNDAQWFKKKLWIDGYDSMELSTIKTDISAIISDIAK